MAEKYIEQVDFRKQMLDILEDIHKFCLENNLRYWIAYGTLLGAVRHKGFIPWDDDMDICLPRPDYERFLKEYSHPNYKVISPYTDKDYPLDYAKVHDIRTIVKEQGGDGNWGIFIDVYPVDGVKSKEEFEKTKKKVRTYRHFVANQRFTRNYRLSEIKDSKKKVAAIAGKLMHPFVSMNYFLKRQDKVMRTSDFNSSELVCNFCGLEPLLFPKEWVSEFEEIPFEDRMFCAPKAYDNMLTLRYGDYMTPPSPERQKSLHDIKAYWK